MLWWFQVTEGFYKDRKKLINYQKPNRKNRLQLFLFLLEFFPHSISGIELVIYWIPEAIERLYALQKVLTIFVHFGVGMWCESLWFADWCKPWLWCTMTCAFCYTHIYDVLHTKIKKYTLLLQTQGSSI